jgi:SAM-dependent methyltransferase
MNSLKGKLSKLEELVFNEGERLIPGKTHNEAESKRHLSSYNFFKSLIVEDRRRSRECFTVVDLGSGAGYGCKLLSEIPCSYILGIDSSIDCQKYAEENYSDRNITYQVRDLTTFIPIMPLYDYVVSRGVFEHIKEGIGLASKVKFKRLFIFDVPYGETSGNPYHLVLGITEASFSEFPSVEFYYQDLDGNITREKPGKPNMMGCICKK